MQWLFNNYHNYKRSKHFMLISFEDVIWYNYEQIKILWYI